MIELYRKYAKILVKLVLGGYLFLFTLNVFHYHNIELQTPVSFHGNNPSLPESNNSNELTCFVVKNYNSIHSLIFTILICCEAVNPDSVNHPVYESANILSCNSFPSNLLRAPPSFS